MNTSYKGNLVHSLAIIKIYLNGFVIHDFGDVVNKKGTVSEKLYLFVILSLRILL